MHLLTSHLLLTVRDLERALAFYTGTLGLALKVHLAGQWAEVAAPGLTIALQPGDAPAPPPQGAPVGLHVASLDEARATLEARGLRFSPETATALSRRAAFTDPDGHPLYLLEYVYRPAAGD